MEPTGTKRSTGRIAALAALLAVMLTTGSLATSPPEIALAATMPAERTGGIDVQTAPTAPADTGVHPVAPIRAFTSDAISSQGIGAGKTVSFKVAGLAGLPTVRAHAFALTVRVIAPTRSGRVTLYRTGSAVPNTSQVRFGARRDASGTALVAPGSGGKVSLYLGSEGAARVGVYVTGWMPTGGTYHAVTPARVLDTRASTALAGGATLRVKATGRAGVPTNVAAVAVQVSAITPKIAGRLTVWKDGAPIPSVAGDVRFATGQSSTGLAVVAAGTNGQVSIANRASRSTHVVVEIVGWFAADGPYTSLAAHTIADTTAGVGVTRQRLAARRGLTFTATDIAGIPQAGVGAVVLSVSAVAPRGSGKLSVWETGTTRSTVPHVVFGAGASAVNLVMVRPGTQGRISLFNDSTSSTDVRVMVVGWIAPGLNEVDTANLVPVDTESIDLAEYNPDGASALQMPAAKAAAVEPGNVVVMPADGAHPKGLIGIVDSVENQGDMAVVNTQPGTIANVLPTFNVNVDGDSPGTVTPNATNAGVAMNRVGVAALAATAVDESTTDQGPNKWLNVSCAGSMSAGLTTNFKASLGTLNFKGGLKWPLDESYVEISINPKVSAYAKAVINGAGSCNATVSTPDIPLPPLYFCIPIVVACVPVWFTQSISAGVEAEVTADGQATLEAGFDAAATLGLHMGADTHSISGASFQPRLRPDIDARVFGDVWIKGEYEIRAYGVVGVRVGLGPFLTLDGPSTDPVNNPYWLRLSGGLRGSLLGKVDLNANIPFIGTVRWQKDFGPFVQNLPENGFTLWKLAAPTPKAPSAPTNVRAIAGDEQAIVSWDPPANVGTSPITDYELQRFNVATGWQTVNDGAGTATTAVVGSLANLTKYQFRVRANNGLPGEYSVASATVTPEPNTWKKVSVGRTHACGIRPSGAALCWGKNDIGQLGNWTYDDSSQPVPVFEMSSGVTDIAAGNRFTCAIQNAVVKCWGAKNRGQGVYTPGCELQCEAYPVPEPSVPGRPLAIAAGDSHGCAAVVGDNGRGDPLRRLRVACWGANDWGQLGDGTTQQRDSPVISTELQTRSILDSFNWTPNVSVTAGDGHSCVGFDGGARCWGLNAGGQLGDGTFAARATPAPVANLAGPVSQISAGQFHTCAVTLGTAFCWGDNTAGQLGIGNDATASPTPASVHLAPASVAAIDAGFAHTCAVTNPGLLYCWGLNSQGEVGDGTKTMRKDPIALTGLGTGIATVAAGYRATCATFGDGVAKCWGQNDGGQLGDGTTASRTDPRLLGVVNCSTQSACIVPPTIVALGDSFMAGEGGRWAGNTDTAATNRIDALGPDAYFDNLDNSAEQIPYCHRSKSAEVHIGGSDVATANLACSGATTATVFDNEDHFFKPGIDFAVSGTKVGQARMLQSFAPGRNVKLILLSVAGNDFGFAKFIEECLFDYLTSTVQQKKLCKDSALAKGLSSRVGPVKTAVKGAIQNIRTAMRDAGYSSTDYTILMQNYPSPIPNAADFRYPEAFNTRQNLGGCPFWNEDADWANQAVTGALAQMNQTVKEAVAEAATDAAKTGGKVMLMDLSESFNGHRLCERTAGLIEDTNFANWTSPGAADASEWLNQVRVPGKFGDLFPNGPIPYSLYESFHPNYWGQLAWRNCVRQAWNGGAVRTGKCTPTGGVNSRGEPNMALR